MVALSFTEFASEKQFSICLVVSLANIMNEKSYLVVFQTSECNICTEDMSKALQNGF